MKGNLFPSESLRLLEHGVLWGLLLLLASCTLPTTMPPRTEIITPPNKIQDKQPAQPEVVFETPTEAEEEPATDIGKKSGRTIAVLLPLSGESAQLGQNILRGMETALYRYANQDFTLKIYDTQGRTLPAVHAARTAVNEQIDMVIGPLFGHVTQAVLPHFQEAGIPVLSFSNSSNLLAQESLRILGESQSSPLYIIGFTPNDELKNLIKFGIWKGLQRFALIAPNDSYGKQIYLNIQNILRGQNVQLSRVEFYDPTQIDFAQAVQRISDFHERRQAYNNEVQRLIDLGIEDEKEIESRMNFKETFGDVPFDAIILTTYDDNSLRTLAAQLEFYDVEPETIQYMGLSQWQNYPNLNLEPSLLGSWHVGLDQQAFEKFQSLYAQMYGESADVFAALGFDVIAMLSYFDQDDPPKLLPGILLHREGFRGATGAYRLNADGTVERKMSIFEIARQGTQELQEAEKGWYVNE